MIFAWNNINQSQLNQMNQLRLIAGAVDGNMIKLYDSILLSERPVPSILTLHKGDEMIGFLCAFFFYEHACEISLVVHPKYRRQGHARALIEKIKPLLAKHDCKTMIFSCPEKINSAWLSQHHLTYLNSEYHMLRNSYEPILESSTGLLFKRATASELNDICALDEACFHNQSARSFSRFKHLLLDNDYRIIIGYHHQEVVGKAHIKFQESFATLSDIAVFPHVQGKGFGSALIAEAINQCLANGYPVIDLDVETQNSHALSLYQRHGFQIDNACDYWQLLSQ